jgi:hypothetical protein
MRYSELLGFLQKLLTEKPTWDIRNNYDQNAKQLVLVARDGGLVRYVHRQV